MEAMRGRSPDKWWGVAIDAPNAPALADFYAGLLGWTVTRSDPGWATVGPPDGVAYLGFQTSAEYERPVWPPADGRQQQMMHLDIEVDDLATATADAVAHGATLAAYQPQADVRVLLDPAGHPFCLYLGS